MEDVINVTKRLKEVLESIVGVLSQDTNFNDDDKPVLIVLARKMTRLLEKCKKDDKEIGELLKRFIIVTEHAIPTFIRTLRGSGHQIIILDDLIIYGLSAEIASESVYYACGIKPKIQGLYKTKYAKSFPFDIDKGHDTIPVIRDVDIPAFTTNNSYKILSLNSPIDLEHTIVFYKFEENEKNKINQVRNCLFEAVKSTFDSEGTSIYQTIHKIKTEEFSNVTVCFNNTNAPHYTNNDFNKLRFFVSDDKLQIVSYAPYMLYEDWLTQDSMLFRNTVFKDVWERVCKEIEKDINSVTFDEELVFMRGLVENEYRQRQKRSKVVWANYLSSFSNVLALKKDIIRLINHLSEICAIQQKGWELDEYDLKLILGHKLGEEMSKELALIYQIPDDQLKLCPHVYYDKDLSKLSLIPERYSYAYSSSNLVHTYYSKNLREALSLIFTNMHFNIGLAANQQLSASQFERLRFGESFDSLEYLLSSFSMQEDVRTELHKWIDERIDLGIVIPKYEQNMDATGRTIWKRYFRAGENEDLYIKVARVCLHEIEIKLNECFNKKDFFALFKNIAKECEDHGLDLNDVFPNDTDETLGENIWSYLCNIPVIVPVKDGYIINRANDITQKLMNGLPWPTK